MVDDVNAAALALRAGAVGYLTKDAAALELVDAVRSVAEGRRYLQPALGAQLATAGSSSGRSAVLRDEELAVLRLLALGHTNAEVARLLGVSLRTVESRRARLFGKLGFRTRAELFRYAADIGVLNRSGLDSPAGVRGINFPTNRPGRLRLFRASAIGLRGTGPVPHSPNGRQLGGIGRGQPEPPPGTLGDTGEWRSGSAPALGLADARTLC